MSANRVAAINPPIDDTDPIRKFSIDPRSHTDWQKQAEFSPKGKPIRNFSIDPISSIRTPIADAIFADAISETPIIFGVETLFLQTPFPRLLFSRSPKAGHPKAGRSDFRNQRFETDTGKTRKMRKVPLTPEKQGSEEIPKSNYAENAENADDWL